MKLAAFPKCFMDTICVDRSMTFEDWIALAAEHLRPLGVTGLEMYHGFLIGFDESYLEHLKETAHDAGFEIPMFCASPDFTSPDPDHRAGEVARQATMIRAAAALGAGTCRVLSGQRRPEVTRSEGVGFTLNCIERLLPVAEECGVILTMENHFKDNYWDFPEFAQKMELFCEIVDRIDSPWFGVNYDPSNTVLANEDPLELLDRVKARVVTMHASDRRPRPGITVGEEGIVDYSQLVHGEIGTGLIDYDRIFELLATVGFDGWISIEDGVEGIEELVRSTKFLVPRVLRS